MADDPLPNRSPAQDRLSQLDLEERWRASRRRHWISDILLALVIVGLAAGAWYMYPIFQKHQAGIARLPDMQKTVDAVQDGLKSAGSKFDEWTANQKTVGDRTEQALRDLRGRLDAVKEEAKAEAGEAAAALTERIQGEFGVKIDKIQTQVAELGSGQTAAQERIASLERDAKEAREQASRRDQDLAALQRRIEEQEALNQRQVADVTDMKQTERRDRRDFDALNDKLSVERVDFEASKNRQRELAPGITLTVTGIDEPYRRITGWVWLVADRRTIWIRNHGAQEPVEFYSTIDGKKRELVITHLAKDSVAGYLLLPKVAGTAAHSPAAD